MERRRTLRRYVSVLRRLLDELPLRQLNRSVRDHLRAAVKRRYREVDQGGWEEPNGPPARSRYARLTRSAAGAAALGAQEQTRPL